MLPAIIAGVVGLGAILVASFWDEILDWIRDFVRSLARAWNSVRDYLPHAARIIGDSIVGAMVAIMHKLYYKDGNQWYEETTTRKIDESEVPPDILAKIKKQENADITEEMELELGLEV